jgi:metal transporter CNNM
MILLFPVAKPTAALLNWWLGPEGITLLRERDFRTLLTRHGETEGAEVGQLEAIGALNFLDLDDIPVLEEGELIDPLSIVTLPNINHRPALPKFERSPTDPFFRQLDASRKNGESRFKRLSRTNQNRLLRVFSNRLNGAKIRGSHGGDGV